MSVAVLVLAAVVVAVAVATVVTVAVARSGNRGGRLGVAATQPSNETVNRTIMDNPILRMFPS